MLGICTFRQGTSVLGLRALDRETTELSTCFVPLRSLQGAALQIRPIGLGMIWQCLW